MERPGKGDAALEAHEQGRVAERCEAAADIGDEEDDEDDDVDLVLTPFICADDGTDHEHGCASRADPAGQDGPNEEQQGVQLGRAGQGALDDDATGDDEEAQEEDDEGNIVQEDRFEESEDRFTHAIGDGEGDDEDERPADSGVEHVCFPKFRFDQGDNSNGQEHPDEGDDAPDGEGRTDHFMGSFIGEGRHSCQEE